MNYELFNKNAFLKMERFEENSFHAIVTDPPYTVVEFKTANLEKMRNGKGGVWRIPPEFDGTKRRPVPRFTVLDEEDKEELRTFFRKFAKQAKRILRPGGHLFLACTQLLMHEVSKELDQGGLERRDVLVRYTSTLRGGDRPKNAGEKFDMVCSMPRVRWEPWLLYRKPYESTLKDCLKEWGTGGLRRESEESPFNDIVKGVPRTPRKEVELSAEAAPSKNGEKRNSHPNLKPQKLMRILCRTALPLEEGRILDPFMGAGSTIAACESQDIESVGIELDETYFRMAKNCIPKLSGLENHEVGIDEIEQQSLLV